MRITRVEKSDRSKYIRVTRILFEGTVSQPIITQFCIESLFDYKRSGNNRMLNTKDCIAVSRNFSETYPVKSYVTLLSYLFAT